MRLLAGFFAILLAFALAAPAADVTGKWKAEFTMQDGSTRVTEFEFQVSGEKLTGTTSTPRGSAEISDGKVSGDEISFSVVRKMQDREMRMLYKGKVSGDQINFDVTFGAQGRTFQMVAKKVS